MIKYYLIFKYKGCSILLNNLYTIIETIPNKITVKFAGKNHPVFQAHFPSYPILPGFLQIDTILDILKDEITMIKYSKFIDHIYPEDIVTFEIKKNDKQSLIKIIKNDKKISEIKYATK